MPAELAVVAGLAREPLVAVVPSAEAKSALGRFPANVPRSGAARDPEGRPEFALIFAVDRPLDMCRTIANVTGDATVSMVVAKSVGKLS